jgi:hypothetical protein
MRGVRRKAALGSVGVLVTLSLAGCALLGIASPGLYNHVDDLAKKLDLSSVGTVQYQGHYGLGWASDIPTLVAIVSGPDAPDQMASELDGFGFARAGEESDSTWSKGDGDSYYQVVVREVKPGDEVLVGKQRLRVKDSGIAISIQ